MSAREKELVLRAWVRFLKHGLRDADFTKRLYDYLIQHCSFIAHYNRSGFYQTYFESGEDTVRFLSQFDMRGECRSVEHGGPWLCGGYADLNRVMVEAAAPNITTVIENARRCERFADLAEGGLESAKRSARHENQKSLKKFDLAILGDWAAETAVDARKIVGRTSLNNLIAIQALRPHNARISEPAEA